MAYQKLDPDLVLAGRQARAAAMRARHRGVKTDLQRFTDFISPEPTSGCWLWTSGVNKWGYGLFYFQGRTVAAHRVSWLLHRGEIGRLHVCHRCDVRCCVNPDHMFLGTASDNAQDSIRKGRKPVLRGEWNHNAKIKSEDVQAIRSDRRLNREIALSYNVSVSLISKIKQRNVWQHINSDGPEAA